MVDRLASRWREMSHLELPPSPEAGRTAVEVRGLTVKLGGQAVLSDVDVEIRHGQLLALVGPNGAGKSTLLGAVAGDIGATTGSIHIDGRPLADWGTRELAMRRSVLLQRIDISFPFTVGDVVRMGRSPWAGTYAEDDDDRLVAAAMQQTDISDLAPREYPSLSGGERARAALARVLAQGTGILLLDEPTAALDIHHQELVMGVARERAAAGVAVVVVAHDLGMAAAWADRVVVLDRGRVAGDGSPRDILTEELLSRVYHHAVEVLPHPRTGLPLIIPRR
jgi:iron complex transport system ATP-binding protein